METILMNDLSTFSLRETSIQKLCVLNGLKGKVKKFLSYYPPPMKESVGGCIIRCKRSRLNIKTNHSKIQFLLVMRIKSKNINL